eukprot:s326_g56.t1
MLVFRTVAANAVKSFLQSDLLALAARYAGGWSALLAGRQGLLDTSLPKVQQGRHVGTAAAVHRSLLLWDIVREGDGTLWTGILPLAPFLRRSSFEDSDGECVLCTYLYPQSATFPGCDHNFEHTACPGLKRHSRFQISASTLDHRTWWHRLSLLGPNCAETQIAQVGFIPDRFAQHGGSPVDPSLPDPSEIVTAVDKTGQTVPGVYRLTFKSFYEERSRWGHKSTFILHLWIDSKQQMCHADLDFAVEDASWAAWLACGRRAPKAHPVPRKRRRA